MSFLLRRSSGKSKDGKQRRRTASGKDFTITKGTGSLQITRSNGRPASLYEASENATWESTVSAKLKDSLPEQEHKRQRVIFELIETEKSFIQDLWVMKSHFRKELETSKCITDKEITMIFSNLDDVIKTNELLYSKVVARRKDGKGVVKKIADIFVDMFGKSKGFNSYVEYCANQLPAQEMYNSLIRTNPQFLDVMKKCEADRQATKGFDLPAFLMKGMQRLLKYHPLIQQILKRTDENDTKERAALQEAMDLVLAHGKIVNEEVRRSENRRRLPQIQAALIRESSSIKWVKPQFDLDLTADPQRTLVYEGKLKFVRAQSSLGTVELRTVDMYLFLLSDMILLTTIRTVDDSIKYVVREIKELSPIISMHSITNITTEMTLPERVRTTLCIEIVEAGTEDGSSLHNADDQIRDGPRRGNLSSKKEYLRFVASAQGQLHTWMSHLRKTRQELTETRRDSLVRTQSLSSLASAMEEYSVTMLVSTESKQSTEESTTLSDWEVSWSTSDSSSNNGTQEHVTLTTRSVRLVQGLDGLGFTLIGRSPVEFQEVDVGGSAYIAGVRQGDQIRAINGQECTNAAHHEVVSLIKEAMSKPRPARFIPVNEPIREIEPADMQSIQSLGRTTRSLRKALLTDPNELELAS